MKHYAVLGHPVAHSLSPRIHAAFAKQTGIAMDYTAIDAAPGSFASALTAFAVGGGVGANITLPHKTAALALCHEVSARARRCGAVNTLTRHGNGWSGDNTDGAGLVRDLTGREQHDLRERRTLLLGAGGAAAGIAPALLVRAFATCTSSTVRPNAPTRSPTRSACRAACTRVTGRTSARSAIST